MTTQEFSNEFTVLLDSYSATLPFGKTSPEGRIVLNEYEKSLFLTMAQDELVTDLYNGNNVLGSSFEGSEELRRYLDPLVSSSVCEKSTDGKEHIAPHSVFYNLPENIAYIVYEQAKIDRKSDGCQQEEIVDVVPVLHDEYERLKRNPFRNSNKRRVLRIDAGDNIVELVSKYDISEYKIRYIRRPDPIITEDFEGTGVSIKGKVAVTECILNPILHDNLLKRAVQLAISIKGNKTVQ